MCGGLAGQFFQHSKIPVKTINGFYFYVHLCLSPYKWAKEVK